MSATEPTPEQFQDALDAVQAALAADWKLVEVIRAPSERRKLTEAEERYCDAVLRRIALGEVAVAQLMELKP